MISDELLNGFEEARELAEQIGALTNVFLKRQKGAPSELILMAAVGFEYSRIVIAMALLKAKTADREELKESIRELHKITLEGIFQKVDQINFEEL